MPTFEIGVKATALAVRLTMALAAISTPCFTLARVLDAPQISTIAEASSVELDSSGVLEIYTARLASGEVPDSREVESALVVIHGYPRDANRTLEAGARAAKQAGRASDTVIVAPLFNARARYSKADVAYLEGELDTGEHQNAFFKILDRSCAANLQGPYRLQRGLAYAAYDKRFLVSNHALAIVPGCAHDVTCIFVSKTARPVLFPTTSGSSPRRLP